MYEYRSALLENCSIKAGESFSNCLGCPEMRAFIEAVRSGFLAV